MSTLKKRVSRGTRTTPPPRPVSDPRSPATKEPAATRIVNSKIFIGPPKKECATSWVRLHSAVAFAANGELAFRRCFNRHSLTIHQRSIIRRVSLGRPDEASGSTCVWLGYWQREVEHRSMAGLAGHSDFAAVSFDDCLGNRQAHARALHLQALIAAAIELFEYQ